MMMMAVTAFVLLMGVAGIGFGIAYASNPGDVFLYAAATIGACVGLTNLVDWVETRRASSRERAAARRSISVRFSRTGYEGVYVRIRNTSARHLAVNSILAKVSSPAAGHWGIDHSFCQTIVAGQYVDIALRLPRPGVVHAIKLMGNDAIVAATRGDVRRLNRDIRRSSESEGVA